MADRKYPRFLQRLVEPCCGLPLQRGALWIAVVQLVMTFALFMHAGIKLTLLPLLRETEVKAEINGTSVEKELDYAEFPNDTLALGILGVSLLVILGLAASFHFFALFRGVKKKDVKRVRLWWRVMFVMTLLTVTFTVLVGVESWVERCEGLVEFFFDIYSLWVIQLYLQHLSGSNADTTAAQSVDNVVSEVS